MTVGSLRSGAALLHLGSIFAALGFAAAPAHAQTATAAVTFEVREINQISLFDDPIPLVLIRSDRSSGYEIFDAHTTWEITTNQPGQKVTALLSDELPPGFTLSVALEAPRGVASRGPVPLATTARDLILDFGSVDAARLGVTYSLTATGDVDVVSSTSGLVTFTIVTGI